MSRVRAAACAFVAAIAMPMAMASGGDVPEPIPWASPGEKLTPVWTAAIIFTVLGLAVAARSIAGHLQWYNHPKIQHYTLRILLTMPVYGVCGLLTIMFPHLTVSLILFRQSFQAFMVYNFVELMVAYFTPHGTEETRIHNLVKVMERLPKTSAKPPCCCVGTIHPGGHFLKDKVLLPVKCFAFAVPTFAIIGLLFDQYNMYAFGVQDSSKAWFWLNLLTVLSTMWALSGLFTVYQVLEHLIKNIKLQNTCIHIVLGPMVLQEFLLGILAETGGLGNLFGLPNAQASAITLVNLLFCIESFLVGLLFAKAFPYSWFYEMDPDTHKFHGAADDDFVSLELVEGRGRRESVVNPPKRTSIIDRVMHRTPDHATPAATAPVGVVVGIAEEKGTADDAGKDSSLLDSSA